MGDIGFGIGLEWAAAGLGLRAVSSRVQKNGSCINCYWWTVHAHIQLINLQSEPGMKLTPKAECNCKTVHKNLDLKLVRNWGDLGSELSRNWVRWTRPNNSLGGLGLGLWQNDASSIATQQSYKQRYIALEGFRVTLTVEYAVQDGDRSQTIERG